jgi:tetratricopeptide (TPR) repeat protein
MTAPMQTGLRTAIITRVPGPLAVDGIVAPTLADLLRCVEAHGLAPCAIADLSLGGWRPQAAYHEFAAQLALPVAAASTRASFAATPHRDALAYADEIGASIDLECLGDRTIISALDAAGRIVAAAPSCRFETFLVLAPRRGHPWGSDNLHFIRFLLQGLKGSGRRVVLASADGDHLSSAAGLAVRWLDPGAAGASAEPLPAGTAPLIGLFPGLIDADVFAALERLEPAPPESHVVLASGQILVAPEYRFTDLAGDGKIDRLASAAIPADWVRAYAQCFAGPAAVDATFLGSHASSLYAAGSYDLAVKQFRRALTCCADASARAQIQGQLQGALIALLRFAEIADTPEPDADGSPLLRGLFHQGRGWACAMLNDAERARADLGRARQLLRPLLGVREYLYLMNISALADLKAGKRDQALAAELEIERALDQLARQDWHLRYINCINLARLHKSSGESEAAGRYYDRAFATSWGTRSAYDCIYENAIRARLCAQQANAGAAFMHWLRAALHWVSNAVPEALPIRTTASFLGRVAAGADLVEGVSAVLMRELNQALAAGPGAPPPVTAAPMPPTFIRASQIGDAELFASARLIGQDGWSVIASAIETREQFGGPAFRALRDLLAGLIAVAAGERVAVRTVIIDDILHMEMPSTLAQALDACARMRCEHVTFNGVKMVLSDTQRNDAQRHAYVRPASGLDDVTERERQTVVTFKRYLSPRLLQGDEAKILRSVGEGASVDDIAARCEKPALDVLRFARKLERDCILVVEGKFPPDYLTRAEL